MDVSLWNIASKMKLPEHLFGNRQVIGAFKNVTSANNWQHGISEIALPDPVCLWSVFVWFRVNNIATVTIRMGLADTVPANQAEMDLATEIFPNLGAPGAGPNFIYFRTLYSDILEFNCKQGMVTGGKKLVIGGHSSVAATLLNVNLVVSGLPDKVPGWPGAWPAG